MTGTVKDAQPRFPNPGKKRKDRRVAIHKLSLPYGVRYRMVASDDVDDTGKGAWPEHGVRTQHAKRLSRNSAMTDDARTRLAPA